MIPLLVQMFDDPQKEPNVQLNLEFLKIDSLAARV